MAFALSTFTKWLSTIFPISEYNFDVPEAFDEAAIIECLNTLRVSKGGYEFVIEGLCGCARAC